MGERLMTQVRCLQCHDRLLDVSTDATGRLEVLCSNKRKHRDRQSVLNVIEDMAKLPVIVPRHQKPVAPQIGMR
jgi:hypothetical protein